MWYCWQTFVGAIIIINAVLFCYILICIDRIQNESDKQWSRLVEVTNMLARDASILSKLQDALEIPRERSGVSNEDRFTLWQEWRKSYMCSCKHIDNKKKE